MKPFQGYVYRITNLLNGKTYIGRHQPKFNESWSSYMGSGVLVRKAILKYGIENFSKELIRSCFDRAELVAAENQSIVNEIQSGGGQYNIYFESPVPISEAMAEKAATLYIEELWRMDDIALEFGISKSRVASLLQSKNVKTRTRYESAKLRKAPKYATCEVCAEKYEITRSRFRGVTCSRSCQSIFGSTTKGVFDQNTRSDSISKAMASNQNAVGNKRGAITAHKRWHVAKNVVKEECAYCT